MIHTKCTVNDEINDKFPLNATNRELHELEGSLWVYPTSARSDGISIFCQVEANCFALIDLALGNRHISAFSIITNEVRRELNKIRRFTGKYTIETI